MMKTSDLAKIVLKMRGRMPESSRHYLAGEILKTIGLHLSEFGGNVISGWQQSGAPQAFMESCELTSGPPWVGHDIAVHDTDLANLINRWMNVESIRRSGGEWEPLTADQNDIRCAIVEDLKSIWEGQSGNTD